MDKVDPDFWDALGIAGEISSPIHPIKRFACAMILRALLDTRNEIYKDGNPNIPRSIVRSGMEWLYHDPDTGPPSFAWCCEILDIDVPITRVRLRSLTEEERKRYFF